MTHPGAGPLDLHALQRRTLSTLVAGQALGAVGITIGIATASLLAKDISGSEELAGLAQTFQVFGTAVSAYVLARLMSARGRRIGMVVGFLTGAVGSVVVVLAGVLGSMPVLLLGAMLLGSTSAANLGARYAATDLAGETTRGRALATVVWATTIGAVAGPNLTGFARRVAESLGIPVLTGPFALGSVGILLAAVVVWVFLRPDPLLVARQHAGAPAAPPRGASLARVASAVRERPVLLAATAGLATAHAVMIAVMVMTPLHMEHGGAELRVIGLVISVHVLGMFAFAPVSGWAADRLGRSTTLALGGMVLLLSLFFSGRSPEGSSWQIFTGLFLLGYGWSLATVASSTLIAEHAPLEARTDVQGMADLVMNVAAAFAGGLAGVVVGGWGYPSLNAFAAVIAAGTLAAAAASRVWLARPVVVPAD